jgi:hypothetical protein
MTVKNFPACGARGTGRHVVEGLIRVKISTSPGEYESNPGDDYMNLPRSFKRIELHLARSKEFPAGSANHGYQFVAPLDRNSYIDVDLWKAHREQCRVRRFWPGEDDQVGFLVHKAGGSEHARWVFDYDKDRVDDDESGYRFGAHAFAVGEYVTIRDQDNDYTFKVVSVEAVR